MKKITYRNNPKLTEKLAGSHNERRLPSKNCNRGKNRRGEKRKAENDVTGRGVVIHWLSRRLSSEGSWVRSPLYQPRRDLGRVFHSQLLVALRREIPA